MRHRARRSKTSESSDVFYAIADPTRRRLLDLLASGEQSAGKLAREFSMSRPAISQHLAVLREAGLVAAQRYGREHRYLIRFAPLVEVRDWVRAYETFWKTKLATLGEHLRKTPSAP